MRSISVHNQIVKIWNKKENCEQHKKHRRCDEKEESGNVKRFVMAKNSNYYLYVYAFGVQQKEIKRRTQIKIKKGIK